MYPKNTDHLLNPAVEHFARFGYAARGVVFLIVAYLAILAATNSGGDTVDSKGALASLLDETHGATMLWVIAAGLACFSIWRLVQTIKDTDEHGTDLKGLTVRGGLLVSCLTYAGLALFTVKLVLSSGASDGGGSGETARWLLEKPYGRYLLGAGGLFVIGAGCAHIFKGLTRKFEKYIDFDPENQKWMSAVCLFGLSARGVLLIVVGGLTLSAAVQFSPENASGSKGALHFVQNLPLGQLWFGIIAFGLLAFGLYSIMESRYRRINPELT